MTNAGIQLAVGDTSELLESIRAALESETGMQLGDDRRERLLDAFRCLIRELRLESPSAVRRQFTDPGLRPATLERVVSYLTVGESYFFRNADHFRALRDVVVPDIIEDRLDARLIRCWSAGCASGEEAYSLAILLDRDLPPLREWDVRILGSDISSTFLARAEAGRYRRWSFRLTNVCDDARYFRPEGDEFVLTDAPRRRVRFQRLNLVRDVYPSLLTQTIGLDLILFRNVAIYLRPDVNRQIIERFAQCLRPGGWLLIGEVEFGRELFDDRAFQIVRSGDTCLLQRRRDAPAQVIPTLPVVDPVVSVPLAPVSPPATPPPTGATVEARRLPPRPRARTIPTRPRRGAPAPVPTLEEARVALAAGRLETATRLLHEVLAADPRQVEPYLLLASLRDEAGALGEAEEHLRAALALDPGCLMAHLLLGMLLRRLGRPEARDVFRTAGEIAAGRAVEDEIEFGEGMNVGRLLQILDLASAGRGAAA